MITRFITEVNTRFNPFSARARSARLFLSFLPPTARSSGMTITTQLLPRTSADPSTLHIKFSRCSFFSALPALPACLLACCPAPAPDTNHQTPGWTFLSVSVYVAYLFFFVLWEGGGGGGVAWARLKEKGGDTVGWRDIHSLLWTFLCPSRGQQEHGLGYTEKPSRHTRAQLD